MSFNPLRVQAEMQGEYPTNGDRPNHFSLSKNSRKDPMKSYCCCCPIDGSPPGSPVPGILQARTLEWVAISFSRGEVTAAAKSLQSCPTLSDPMDCGLPGSSVHGNFQTRVLEWVAISFSRGFSWPMDRMQVSYIVDRCLNLWATKEVPIIVWPQVNSREGTQLHP